jgi:hypothetical protein
MNKFSQDNQPCLVNFRQIYKQNIAPKIQGIDIFLKTAIPPYAPKDVANILGCSLEEILHISEILHITEITKIDFFSILHLSSSYICQLIKKQWKYGNIPYYTPEIIADIYDINLSKIEEAFAHLSINEIKENELQEVFSHISMSVFTL